jgi:hypothetical protein
MTKITAESLSRTDRLHEKFKSMIAHRFFIRAHMSGMLSIVVASGVLGSRLFRFVGLKNMAIRYPLMVLLSYLVFFLLIRLWLRYVARAMSSTRSGSSGILDAFDGSIDLGGRSSGIAENARLVAGGGRFGGGGASASFAEGPVAPLPVPQAPAARLTGKGFSLSSLDGGDDGIVLLVLFVTLVIAILGAGFYIIYQAPAILSDAAFQACLGSGLFRTARDVHDPSWTRSVLKTTVIPFLIVLVLAAVLGYEAHKICPAAATLREVWSTCLR